MAVVLFFETKVSIKTAAMSRRAIRAGPTIRFRSALSIRRQMVDHFRQMLAQARQQLVAGQAGLRHQAVDLVGAKRVGEIVRRDLLVRAGAHPGTGGFAMAVLLKLFQEVAKAAADHAASRRQRASRRDYLSGCRQDRRHWTAKHAPRPPPVEGAGAGAGSAGRVVGGQMLDRFPRQQTQDRHGHRRHATGGALGLLGPRGPFCMPLRTSSKPMVLSCRYKPRLSKHTGGP